MSPATRAWDPGRWKSASSWFPELLALAVARGARGIILFAVNRPEGRWFEPAADIDPQYAQTLSRVVDAGVEVVIARLEHGDDTLAVTGSVHVAGRMQ